MASTGTQGLVLRFRARNTVSGVTRETLKALAAEFDTSETEVVHIALSRLAKDTLPAYEADDAALTREQLAAVKRVARATLPQGRIIKKQALF